MSMLINRENYIQKLEKLKDKHIIKAVTGLRRSGKSTLFEIFANTPAILFKNIIRLKTFFFINSKTKNLILYYKERIFFSSKQ